MMRNGNTYGEGEEDGFSLKYDPYGNQAGILFGKIGHGYGMKNSTKFLLLTSDNKIFLDKVNSEVQQI